jgi:hypothetical protein
MIPGMTKPAPASIIVPRTHGQVLIEPPLAEQALALDATPNFLMKNNPFGADLAVLRRLAREQFVQVAKAWAQEIHGAPLPADALERRWVITGHQVEFYHAGVWAKVIAADELVRRSRQPAIAFDLLVDHDVVDELGFEVPVQSPQTGDWSRIAVTFGEPPAGALPAESLPAPAPAAFAEWDARLADFPATHTDSLAFFLSTMRPSGGVPASYTQWMSAARARFEASMDLRVHHVPTSLLCRTESWLTFVGAWLEHAPEMTALYNAHLAHFRKLQGIRNPQHPMPDLARAADADGGTFELPFWIYQRGNSRQRLEVLHKNGRRSILLEGREFDVMDGLTPVLAAGWMIRPRALTLTMFTRLFLADFFIHGIGGALYDQITDGLLEELFGNVPPYGCVSAAWLLPLGRGLSERESLSVLRWRRHHAEHNPQQLIDPFTALRTEVAELITARKSLLERTRESLERSRKDPDERRERRRWFDELHAINKQLHAKAPRLLGELDREIAEARRDREQEKVLRWREYFFALHPGESLRQLVSTIRASR